MKLTEEQQQAYDWAIKQSYPSVAATYAKILAGVITQFKLENEQLQEHKPGCWCCCHVGPSEAIDEDH